MSTRSRLERLTRVRRAQRDRARIETEAAARSVERAELEQRERELGHADAADHFVADARIGLLREQWRAGIAGLRQLGDAAANAGRKTAVANEYLEAASEGLVAASRRLRGAERLSERAEQALRRKALRAAQRRLDELTQQRRSQAPKRIGVLLLAGALLAGAGPSSGEATAEAQVTPGVALLLGEIRVLEAKLDTRAQELDDREQHLDALEATIRERLDELETITGAVERRISDWENAHGDKSLSRLAKIYGTMEPRTAASLIEGLELDLATRIIAKMKHKQSAALLPLMSQARALAMSRSVAHPLGNPPPAARAAR